jgi:hypothetical protein
MANTTSDTLSTGFSALDDLLGGSGFALPATVLLCGGPGTGKTTFVWQMIDRFLCDNADVFVQYCAFEESGSLSLKRSITHNAKLSTLEKAGQIVRLPWETGIDPETDLSVVIRDKFPKPTEDQRRAGARQHFDFVSGKIAREEPRGRYVLVIDGLNALLDWASLQFPESRPRELMSCVEQSFQIKRVEHADDPPTVGPYPPDLIIMTAEEKTDRPDKGTQSYVADVVIELSTELCTPDKKHPKYSVRLRKCTVQKGRGLHVQNRSVTYDFTRDGGIKFYESYGAAGRINFFHENSMQREEIREFETVDVPVHYPLLDVRLFDRAHMYDEYTVRYVGTETPRRCEMTVSHVDEYWPVAFVAEGLIEYVPRRKLSLYRPWRGEFIHEMEEKFKLMPGFLRRDADGEALAAVPFAVNISFIVYHEHDPDVLDVTAPETWDELEEVCLAKKRRKKDCFPLAIETNTIDSFVATILELFWSHAGGWHTVQSGDNLEIKFLDNHDEKGAIAALERLRQWFAKGLVRQHGTLDPKHPTNVGGSADWVFARHWYSTLIEHLAAVPLGDLTALGKIRTCGIPIAKDRRFAVSASTWGEWCLAVDRGTENRRFAYNLIGNLLSSRKVIRRGIRGAGLPVFEQFYKEFGNARCYGTEKTFQQVRDAFFPNAISRARFARYRSVMQKIYAAAFCLMTNPETVNAEDAWNQIKQSIQAPE